MDASYNVTLTLTDTVGTVSTYALVIPSAAYIMHIKKGGRAVGFGTAAGADETVTFGWPVKLNKPLEVSQGRHRRKQCRLSLREHRCGEKER